MLVHEFPEDGVCNGAVDGCLVHERMVEGIMHDCGGKQRDGGDADGGSIPDISPVQDEFGAFGLHDEFVIGGAVGFPFSEVERRGEFPV